MPRLPAGERDRRLADEVLYLHSLWHRGGPVPAPAAAPIQFRSVRHEERDRRGLDRVVRRREDQRLVLCRLISGNGRKRRWIDPAAAAAAAEPGPSSKETWAEAAADPTPTPPSGNPPAPTTPIVSLAQRKAVRSSSVNFSAADTAADEDGSDSEGEKAVEEEAARYFTALFEQDAQLRGHYKERWRKGRFHCLVCAAGGGGGKTVLGKRRVQRHGNCVALVRHLRETSRARGRFWNYRKRGAHRGLGVVVCRMFGWDFHSPHLKAVLRRAKKEEDARKNNGDSTDDDDYSIDEDEETEDEGSEGEEEDIETWMQDPGTDGDEEDSEIESSEEYAEKEAANSIARKQDIKIRDCLLRLTHAKSVDTTPKETEVQKRSHVPNHKEVSTPGSKFNEGSDIAKRKVSASSYQGLSLKSSESRVVKKMKVNQQPSKKGKQSETNETGASARKAKRPAVAARKARQLANKQLSKKQLAKKAKKELAKKAKKQLAKNAK